VQNIEQVVLQLCVNLLDKDVDSGGMLTTHPRLHQVLKFFESVHRYTEVRPRQYLVALDRRIVWLHEHVLEEKEAVDVLECGSEEPRVQLAVTLQCQEGVANDLVCANGFNLILKVRCRVDVALHHLHEHLIRTEPKCANDTPFGHALCISWHPHELHAILGRLFDAAAHHFTFPFFRTPFPMSFVESRQMLSASSEQKKVLMDPNDSGYFRYNDKYPPMCVEGATTTNVEQDIVNYLQESYREGLKHECVILPCGLSAGEAGVMYFRGLNQKRMPQSNAAAASVNVPNLIRRLESAIETVMGICVRDAEYAAIFAKHIHSEIFVCKQYRRKIVKAVKAFLKETDLNKKGYTSKLKSIMASIGITQ
jgi:hypothetical protein